MKRILAVLLLILCLLSLCSCARTDTGALFDKVCSADEALKRSKSSNTVVCEDLKCTGGQDVWDAFCRAVDSGEAASVLCAHYYTLDREHVSEEYYEEEKEHYPQLFFCRVEYDGSSFTVTIRESTEKEPETHENYRYLRHFTGDAPAQAAYSSYDYYVLTDDDTVTWEDIFYSMVSSQSDALIRHCTVYQNIME